MELNANNNLPIARKSRPPPPPKGSGTSSANLPIARKSRPPSPPKGSGTSSDLSVATPRKDDCEFPLEETVSASELKVNMIKRLLSWQTQGTFKELPYEERRVDLPKPYSI